MEKQQVQPNSKAEKLLFDNRSSGATVFTQSTIRALDGIYHVNRVAFRNSAFRTFGFASSTSKTFISNHAGHDISSITGYQSSNRPVLPPNCHSLLRRRQSSRKIMADGALIKARPTWLSALQNSSSFLPGSGSGCIPGGQRIDGQEGLG